MDEPIKKISKLFGSDEEPVLFLDTHGVYRAGNIIIKPILEKIESEELAEIINQLPVSEKIRIPKPIKSINGNWIEEGYVAWTYLEGKEVGGRYKDKIEVCDFFTKIFQDVSKPKFIEARNNPWAIADRVTWGELKIQYEEKFQNIINVIQPILKPNNLSYQIIHGDITRNIIFNEKEFPGVIDLTLYWRPKDYAKALLIVDAITWEDTNLDVYNLVVDVPEINQLLLRAGLRRIIEQPEHVKYFGKNKDKALEQSSKYLETLKKLNLV